MRLPTAPLLPLLRACCLAVAAVLFSSPAWAATLGPLYNYVDVPVAKPASAQRVKTAIVNAALLQFWSIVENPDGSLTASMWKYNEYDFKVRITYDAKRYSITYLGSDGLSATIPHRAKPGEITNLFLAEKEREKNSASEAKIDAVIKSSPAAPFAARTEYDMHPAPNTWLRDLLGGIRRELAAPEI